MSNLFIAGVFGILLSGIFSTMLMLMNVEAQSYPVDPCTFSSGYGVGVRACTDSLIRTAPPLADASVVTQG